MASLKALITSLRLDALLNSVTPYSAGTTLGSYVKVFDLDTLSLKTPVTELIGLSEFVREVAVYMRNVRKFYLPNQISLSGKQAYDLISTWQELVHFEAILAS